MTGSTVALVTSGRAAWLATLFRSAYARNLGLAAAFLLAIAFDIAIGLHYFSQQADYGTLGFDFRGTLYEPARAIVHGASPYPDPTVAQVQVGNPALYPPLFMLVVVPLTVFPWQVAFGMWVAVLAAGLFATVWLLGGRDWRCYVAVALIPTLWVGLVYGNVAVLLLPLAALAWRLRDRQPLLAGAAVGLAIAAKLYLWPIAIWLLATRRFSALVSAVVTAIGGALFAWSAIRFDGLTSYPDLLRVAETVYAGHSDSLATAAAALGLGTSIQRLVCLGAALLIGALAFGFGARGHDASAFSLTVLAAILGASIAWPYTFTLVLVPIAIAYPRFALAWLAPMLFLLAEALPRPVLEALPSRRPVGVPSVVWAFDQAPPGLWPALGYAGLAAAMVALAIARIERGRSPSVE